MAEVTVEIENSYECGRESKSTVVLELPEGVDMDEWFEDTVQEHTGDGHPCGERENAIYAAKIVAATDPTLIGESHEWG